MENKHILHMIFKLLFAQCLLGKIITNRVRQHFHLSIELQTSFYKEKCRLQSSVQIATNTSFL